MLIDTIIPSPNEKVASDVTTNSPEPSELEGSWNFDGDQNDQDESSSSLKESNSQKRRQTRKSSTNTELESVLSDESQYVRRSTRDPSQFYLKKGDVQKLLQKIVTNDEDTVILKIKQHGLTDINTAVLTEVIKALHKNKICQALYLQNISKAFHNEQLQLLMDLLQVKPLIWCLNIGENYEISIDMWKRFCKHLPLTNITHIYISEHVIPIELKNEIRYQIRENRKKHDRHCNIKNLSVIERCTHMWWNPINGVKELKPKVAPPTQPPRRTIQDVAQCPENTAFWQEGVGKGGDKPWKFKCICGEVCSSYESFRYHPVGRMYECSRCSIWSHVDCVLGPSMTDEDLEEIVDLLCNPCNTKISRLKRYYGDEYKEHDDRSDVYVLSEKDLVRHREGLKRKREEEEEQARQQKEKEDKQNQLKQSKTEPKPKKPKNVDTPKKKEPIKKKISKQQKKKKEEIESSEDEIDEDEADGEWRFKCLCGETCSWYENPLYRPKGRKFQCTNCNIWSHVGCMLGDKITDEEIHALPEAFCYTCKAKMRRMRGRQSEEVIPSPKEEIDVQKEVKDTEERS